jgi:uncharacterized protein with NAD-binding domain and iron-sulfur cluster
MAKVIILGGGVAGMSAAQELAERGFEVEVYEKHKHYAGGKARSTNVKTTDEKVPGKFLPGEHGFRFFPGFYKHITDTMGRIPFVNADGSKSTVVDNLVSTDRVRLARNGKPSIITIVNFPHSLADLEALLASIHSNTGLTEEEKKFFALRIWQLATSCYDRRANDYERLSWWKYLEADRFSDNYRGLLVQGITRTLVAANAKYASTKTGGDIFLQLLFNIANPSVHTDRVLDGPTNDVFINPWLAYLESLGVKYHRHTVVTELKFENGNISGAVIVQEDGSSLTVTGDYYILATPVEKAAGLLNADILKADPTLEGIKKLAPSVAWMNGVQYYLNKEVDIIRGHCIYSDSPWALTSISQLQFWNNYDIADRGNGKVKTILSVDVSDWEAPGIGNSKPANDCNRTELKIQIWEQLKLALNVEGNTVITDDMIEFWHIDGDIKPEARAQDEDAEPLLVNTINSWDLRPEAYTFIPNLFLASDYVRTYTDLATMEGSNEAARRAVNAILNASNSSASQCEIWNLHEPLLLAPFRNHDQKRYDKGLPWQLYEPWWLKIILAIINFFRKLFGHKKR